MEYLPTPRQSRLRTWAEERYYRGLWDEALRHPHEYPEDRFEGRGLVFCAGGERLFVNLWVNLCLLRRMHQCGLPVELWHFGREELTPFMAALLEPFDVRIVDGENHTRELPKGKWRGFALKTTAIIQSRFRETLFLDADSYPVRNPEFLFSEPGYRWAGSCFWPDIHHTDPASKMWRILDIPRIDEAEWESGQMVVDKRRAWRPLSLVNHLSRHYRFHYRHMYGDKMTFYAAWKKLDHPYAMTRHPASLAAAPDSRMLLNHYDFHGELLFQHRTDSDYSLSAEGEKDWRGFVHEKACAGFLDELREKWPATERVCKPNRSGKRERPLFWKCIRAAWRTGRIAEVKQPLLPPPAANGSWDASARHALLTPGIVSPRLMGTAIHALTGSREEEIRMIFRFFAAMIFVDPRLAAMLPENLEMEGTRLEKEWRAIEEFKKLALELQGKMGMANVRGNLSAFGAPPELAPGERDFVKQFVEILSGSPAMLERDWEAFWARAGIDPRGGNGAREPVPSASAKPWRGKSRFEKVLVLTPIKDCAELARTYCHRLSRLNYPPELLSLGLLESDSTDGTFEAFDGEVKWLGKHWRRASLWKQDYNYRLPEGVQRWETQIQLKRRQVMALGRNELLRRALGDEDWVLWLDADVIDYPRDIIEQLLSYGKEILHPRCVLDYGGVTFDQNGWRDHGRVHMHHVRGRELLAPLDAVGGTMLFIRADLHRRGLIYPVEPYGAGNPRIRSLEEGRHDPERPGEVETEGLGIMASDMGVQCWGLPELEILHRKK